MGDINNPTSNGVLIVIIYTLDILKLIFIFLADIPLVPSLITGDPDREPNFVLHWLNNKEMHFSLQAETILHVI